MKKVPVQKGTIIADVPTMKHMSVEKRALEDYQNKVERQKGQSLEYATPKTKK